MTRTIGELCDEFNKTAQSYTQSNVSVDLLITKYAILLKHKAQDLKDRERLAGIMYDAGVQWLTQITQPGTPVVYTMPARMLAHFNRMTAEDSIALLPARAPGELTDIALDLLRRAEGPKGGDSESRGYLVKLADQALGFADAIRDAHEKAAAEVATSQDIAPGKKIALKPKDEKLSL
jgi:hypothetical protein